MKREKLLRDKEYATSQMQLKLLNLIGEYMKQNKLLQKDLSKELGVSKGYISQLLNATYDHKLSKVAELALSCNAMPLLNFVNLDNFIEEDSKDKYFELFPVLRQRNITFEVPNTNEAKVVKMQPVYTFLQPRFSKSNNGVNLFKG